MRIMGSFLLVSLFLSPMPGASGDKKTAKTVCKRAETSGLQLEVCVLEKNKVGNELICTVSLTNKTDKAIEFVWDGSGDFRSFSQFRNFAVELKDSEGKLVPWFHIDPDHPLAMHVVWHLTFAVNGYDCGNEFAHFCPVWGPAERRTYIEWTIYPLVKRLDAGLFAEYVRERLPEPERDLSAWRE